MNPGETYAIGIDIGGTTVKAGIVTPEGKIVDTFVADARGTEGPAIVIGQVNYAVEQLLSRFERSHCRGIGIGCPGIVGLDNDTVSHPPNLHKWHDEKLGSAVMAKFPYPVKVENDANVAALAEARYGAGVEFNDFVFVIWGTGVGGGIIVNKEIFRGSNGAAGEIGHVTIDYKGPICNCGSRGCIESYIGQKYLSQRTRDLLIKYPDSIIGSLVASELHKIEPVIIARAAEQGDAAALEILEEAGTLLGYALASLTNILDIRTFVIGGGVSAAPDFVYTAMKLALQSRALIPHQPHIKIVRAKLGNSAGIIGAASLVM